jgi:hypothetical protein
MWWEDADLVEEPSIRSFVPEPLNQLRDPIVFTDLDGQRYLFYAAAGVGDRRGEAEIYAPMRSMG